MTAYPFRGPLMRGYSIEEYGARTRPMLDATLIAIESETRAQGRLH